LKYQYNTAVSAVNLNIHDLFNSSRIIQAIFDLLSSMSNHYQEIYISHDGIASKIHCSRRQVIRAIKYLVNAGAISKKKNGFQESNNYFLNPIFYDPEMRAQLANFFKSFARWGMNSLMRAAATFKKNVTLLYMNIINNLNLPVYEREWGYEHDIIQAKKNKNTQQEKILDRNVYYSSTKDYSPINTNVLFAKEERMRLHNEINEKYRRRYEKQRAEMAEARRLEEEKFKKSPRVTKEFMLKTLKEFGII
jgi:predicted transcriptional regulator